MPAALTEPEIIVGVVGCSAVVEAYPLGPAMMQRLERRLAEVPGARAENMTWGPIHIVQQYQDEGGPLPARLVLIGYASVSTCPGRVTAHRRTGGVLSDAAVQERVHEAVTGVVDLENTLMIGERFGIWPPECYTVEADIPADTFGHMVMAESAGRDGDAALTALLGFSPARMVDEVIAAAVDLAANGPAARTDVTPKGAGDLVPPVSFMRNRAAAVCAEDDDDNERTRRAGPADGARGRAARFCPQHRRRGSRSTFSAPRRTLTRCSSGCAPKRPRWRGSTAWTARRCPTDSVRITRRFWRLAATSRTPSASPDPAAPSCRSTSAIWAR